MKYIKIGFWVSVFINILFILAYYGNLEVGPSLNMLINTDTMYLPSLYQDLIIENNTLCGWNINASPNLFPDIILYFIISLFSSNIIIQFILFSVIQYFIIVWSLRKIYTHLLGGQKGLTLAFFSNLMLSLIFFSNVIENHFEFTYYIIINSFHFGAFTCALLGIWFLVAHIKTKKNLYLYLLFLLCVLASFSDRLFLISFVIPIVLALVLGVIVYLSLRRKSIKLILLISVSSYLGLYIYNVVKEAQCLVIVSPFKEFAFEDMKKSFDMFWNQVVDYSTYSNSLLIIYCLTAISIILLIGSALYSLIRYKKSSFLLVKVYLSLALVAIIFAPIVNGVYTGYDTLRYNYSAYILAIIIFPLILHLILKFNRSVLNIKAGVLLGLQFSVFLIYGIKSIGNVDEVVNYYPDKSKAIDYFSEKYKLKKGVCPFWDSKVTTFFSDSKTKLCHVFDDLTPYHHVTNENWFYGDNSVFNFVIYHSEEQLNHIIKRLSLKEGDYTLDEHGPFKICLTPDFKYKREGFQPYLISLNSSTI